MATMTADSVEVLHLTESEAQEARQAALDFVGLTFEDLRDQAKIGQFDSLDARLAWIVVQAVDQGV